MGLFDWLRGQPRDAVARGDDVIWLSSAAKQRGMCRAIEGHLQKAPLVLVVVHFADTLDAVRAEFDARGLAYAELDDSHRAAAVVRQAAASSEAHLLLALAERLQPDTRAGGGMPVPALAAIQPVEIVVAERHFLRERDEALFAFSAGLGCPVRVTFHLSLRDPLLRPFAGEWLESVLGRLGAKEDEPIVSNLVSRRLRGAQDKYTQLAATERRASSAEEWLALNVRDGGA